MKFRMFGVIVFGLAAVTVHAQDTKKVAIDPAAAPKAAAAPNAADIRPRASYAIGLSLGRQFKTGGVDVDVAQVMKGLQDGLAGTQPPLSDEELQAALEAFQGQLQAKQQATMAAAAAKAKQEGLAYLAANAKQPGVRVLPSGLQYKVLKEGAGASPKATDTVTTHYAGTLIDGTKFDSSYDRGEPASFPVGGVIKGWTEALQLMKVGSKWQLVIPAELAYGDQPPPGAPIPPGATLVFEVELLGIGAAK
jgi:FKBP-type peptidyl-prolyl cis-trans isomerase FklB